MKMDSLIYLDKWCLFLHIILKLLWLMGWLVWLLWWWMGEGSFRCSLYLSPKVLEVSPMYSSSQVWSHTDTNRWHHLGDHGVFVLGGDQEVLDGAATFEVSLDPIPTTDLFDTFTKTLCVGYDYVTLTLNFSGGNRGAVSTLVVKPHQLPHWKTCWAFSPPCPKPTWDICIEWGLFWDVLFLVLSKSGLLHTVLALWERVLITLNLTERLWWLSHCRYWSVWVGFLYTVMDRLSLSSGFTMVSKEGDWNHPPCCPLLLILMAGSKLLMCWRKPCLLASLWITKVSSTYLHQNLGGGVQY